MPLPSESAGRFCPTDYALPSDAFSLHRSIGSCDVLYVVGGLYGNTVALDVILKAFKAETSDSKRLVFNGDFHWFDVAVDQFTEIETKTSPYLRLRGNVETELSRSPGGDVDAGCGCAYPSDVADSVVEYSNLMTSQLRSTYHAYRSQRELAFPLADSLADLPMTARLEVAGVGVGITHGDDQSLAGWRFSHDNIARSFENGLDAAMAAANVGVLASSHTCLPVLFHQANLAIINNGAAGMANFAGSTYGLITRIAHPDLLATSCGLPIAYETTLRVNNQYLALQTLQVGFADLAWQHVFLSQWPSGTPGYLSYWDRVQRGPNYTLKEAMQYER